MSGDLVLSLETVALLLRQGTDLPEALQRTARRSTSPQSDVWKRCAERVGRGDTLSQAFQAEPGLPPILHRGLTSAGQEDLPTLLEEAARLLDGQQRRFTAWRNVLAYPAILTSLSLGNFWLMSLVVNQFSVVFDSMAMQLPIQTRAILFLSRPAVATGLTLLTICLLALLGLDWVRIRLPIVGYWLRKQEACGFMRWLAYLLQHGAPLPEAIREASWGCCCRPFRNQILQAAARVEAGHTLSRALGGCWLFPRMALWLVAHCDARELAPDALARAATVLWEDAESRTTDLFRILEPLFILGFGGLVVFLVSALFLPLYQMIGNVG